MPGGGLSPSLPFAMALACFGMGMTFEEALVGATINGAWSLDRSDTVEHPFDKPLRFPEGAQYTYEIDLAWEPDAGCPPLALLMAPKPS